MGQQRVIFDAGSFGRSQRKSRGKHGTDAHAKLWGADAGPGHASCVRRQGAGALGRWGVLMGSTRSTIANACLQFVWGGGGRAEDTKKEKWMEANEEHTSPLSGSTRHWDFPRSSSPDGACVRSARPCVLRAQHGALQYLQHCRQPDQRPYVWIDHRHKFEVFGPVSRARC